MIEQPPITWFPAAAGNYTSRPQNILYEAVVIHTTAGGWKLADLGRWFGGENLRQGMRGSTHFGVDRDGNIGQFVSLQNMAIAHGNEPEATARLARENTASANAWAIGIEHLDGGMPGAVTNAQAEASARLTAWLFDAIILPNARQTGAAVDRDHILGHYELAPRTRPRCPSWGEERFARYIARVRELLAGDVPQPTIEQVRYGLIEKIVRGEYAAARDDLLKIAPL